MLSSLRGMLRLASGRRQVRPERWISDQHRPGRQVVVNMRWVRSRSRARPAPPAAVKLSLAARKAALGPAHLAIDPALIVELYRNCPGFSGDGRARNSDCAGQDVAGPIIAGQDLDAYRPPCCVQLITLSATPLQAQVNADIAHARPGYFSASMIWSVW